MNIHTPITLTVHFCPGEWVFKYCNMLVTYTSHTSTIGAFSSSPSPCLDLILFRAVAASSRALLTLNKTNK